MGVGEGAEETLAKRSKLTLSPSFPVFSGVFVLGQSGKNTGWHHTPPAGQGRIFGKRNISGGRKATLTCRATESWYVQFSHISQGHVFALWKYQSLRWHFVLFLIYTRTSKQNWVYLYQGKDLLHMKYTATVLLLSNAVLTPTVYRTVATLTTIAGTFAFTTTLTLTVSLGTSFSWYNYAFLCLPI